MSFSRKLRFTYLFLIGIAKRQYKNIIIGLALGALGFYLFPKIIPYLNLKKGSVLKIGIVGRYQIGEIPSEILEEISYGLVQVSEKGEYLPKLALGWKIEDEGKKYTFNITPEKIYWHDGKEFSSSDINYNFKGVEIQTTPDSISFTLKEPLSPFPVFVSKPLFRQGLIGLGEYKVQKISQKGKIIQSLYLIPWQNKSLPKKIYRFYQTEEDLKTAFNLGEINIVNNLLDLNNLYLSKNVQINKKLLNNAYIGLFYNTSKPPYSSKTFRQALAYCLDKDPETRATGPINPLSWAYNPDVKLYQKDLAHAQKLLEDEKIDKTNLKIIISSFPQFEKIANKIKENLGEIGLNSEVKIVNTIPEDFDVLLMAREIPPDPDQYYFWHSTQAGNISKFKSPRIDKLLEDGRKTIKKEERKTIYFDFQRFLSEEIPVVFLSHPVVYSIIRK